MCALRFMDGFDHSATAQLVQKWTATLGSIIITGTSGRNGTSGLVSGGTSINRVDLTLDNQPTWIAGFAMRVNSLPTTTHAIFTRWVDGATNQIEIGLDTTGHLTVWRGGTVLLGTSVVALTTAIYYYFEYLVNFHATAGDVVVRINGAQVLTLSGIATSQSGNAFASAFRIGNLGDTISNLGMAFDDVYLCDGTGPPPHHTFLGDCRVSALFPAGDGTYTAWTPSTGTLHSAVVDEADPNGDTDYLSSSTAAARETHVLTDVPAMPPQLIYGVQHCLNARKDDAAVRTVRSVLKSGGTTQAGAVTHTLTTSFSYYKTLFVVDPDTGAPWTTAALNSVEAGVEHG